MVSKQYTGFQTQEIKKRNLLWLTVLGQVEMIIYGLLSARVQSHRESHGERLNICVFFSLSLFLFQDSIRGPQKASLSIPDYLQVPQLCIFTQIKFLPLSVAHRGFYIIMSFEWKNPYSIITVSILPTSFYPSYIQENCEDTSLHKICTWMLTA